MRMEAYLRLHTPSLVALLLFGTIIWAGCPKRPSSPPSPPPPKPGSQPAPTMQLPDLTISAIEVLPAQPSAGQRFAVNVYVKNVGQAPSGAYDLAMSIRDVSRGSTYPIGTFRKEGLRPGENVAAYTSTDALVNFPGSHQVHVAIQPFGFTDGNEQNNASARAFTVK
jgi:hypothetical protein